MAGPAAWRDWQPAQPANAPAVSGHPPSSEAAAVPPLKGRTSGKRRHEGAGVRPARAIRAQSLRIFDRSFAVTRYLQMLAIGIGLFGIAASFSAQVLARRREFGLLSHLGFTRQQVVATVAGEGVAWTAAGALLGLGLGLAVAVVLGQVNHQSFTDHALVPVPGSAGGGGGQAGGASAPVRPRRASGAVKETGDPSCCHTVALALQPPRRCARRGCHASGVCVGSIHRCPRLSRRSSSRATTAPPEFRTEWWYATGADHHRRGGAGFQVTFFRTRGEAVRPSGPRWAAPVAVCHAASPMTARRRQWHGQRVAAGTVTPPPALPEPAARHGGGHRGTAFERRGDGSYRARCQNKGWR
jgi:hypothetical protein